MAAVIEPPANQYHPEWRYQFPAGAAKDDGVHVVLSGHVNHPPTLHGTADNKYETFDVRLVVGPYWARSGVVSVVPQVFLHQYENTNSDEDDQQGWEFRKLRWDTLSGGGPPGEQRIRLRFEVSVKGENSRIIRFGYYVFAFGHALGSGGLYAPPPAHPNP